MEKTALQEARRRVEMGGASVPSKNSSAALGDPLALQEEPSAQGASGGVVEGTVDRVVVRRDDWGILDLALDETRGDGAPVLVRVAGRLPAATRPGLRLRATGAWETHPKFGRQFQARLVAPAAPATAAGVAACVARLVEGVGPVRAAQFVAGAGGAAGALALLGQGEAVSTVPTAPAPDGAGPDGYTLAPCSAPPSPFTPRQWADLRAAWAEAAGSAAVDVDLASLGLSLALAGRLRVRYGREAAAVARARPWNLALDVDGVGWATADALAARVGVDPDDPARLAAALDHALREDARQEGHTFAPAAVLRATLARLCATRTAPVDEAAVAAAAAALGGRRRVRVGAGGGVGLAPLVDAERAVAGFVALRRAAGPRPLSLPAHGGTGEAPAADAVMAEVARAAAEAGLVLAPEQAAALARCHAEATLVLTGGPGVGKTTVTKAVLALWTRAGLTAIVGCAPTGRAARRLREATGLDAKTIHRVLAYVPGQGFRHTAANPLPVHAVVVDEASMIDAELMAALVAALPLDCRVLFVGDPDQLPPVGPGAPLRDLVAARALPVAALRTVHRQAAGSAIVLGARAVQEARAPTPSPPGDRGAGVLFHVPADGGTGASHVVALVRSDIPSTFNLSMEDIMVVAPMRKGPLGVTALNRALQAALNPRPPAETLVLAARRARGGGMGGGGASGGADEAEEGAPRELRVGDRIMQTRNDADRGLVNGELGVVEAVFADGKGGPGRAASLAARFPDGAADRLVHYGRMELDQVDLAYASTVHKIQGSEFPAVVVVLHEAHGRMLERSLFYTALTRGKRLVVTVGTRSAQARAAKVARTGERRTVLSGILPAWDDA